MRGGDGQAEGMSVPSWAQGSFSWCWRAAERGPELPDSGESSVPGGWKDAEMSNKQRKER